jgi:hypothetical protein
MCRYGEYVYKEHYACFSCRKMFRRPMRHELARPIGREETRVVPCPQCGQAMTNLGKDFKAPRQGDVRQWQKVQELYANGYSFDSCGCSGPEPRPATLQEVKPFLAEQKRLKAERERQARIEQRAAEMSQRRNKKARLLQEKRATADIRALA